MGSGDKNPGTVDFADTFLKYYDTRYSKTTISRIDDFIEHVEANGVHNWVGKVSRSDNVPEQAEDRDKIISYAQQYNLWHAHIGDPDFDETEHGRYKVSDWVIHFQYFNNYHIKLLELDSHNPMSLPKQNMF